MARRSSVRLSRVGRIVCGVGFLFAVAAAVSGNATLMVVALLALVGEVAVRSWQLGRPGMPQWRVGKRAPSAGTGTGKATPSVTQSKPPHSESRPSHPPGTALGDAPGALGDALAELKRRRRH